MPISLLFLLNAAAFGVGLAMDAFSVSLANGLHEPNMKNKKLLLIAGVFAVFQILMPLVGWFCVHTIASLFSSFQKFIPWIALALLLYIGGGMLKEGFEKHENAQQEAAVLGFGGLMLQGVATSIDALSVGFTIADLAFGPALLESVIIGVVTFAICVAGVKLGKRFGTRLAGKASILGGVILIAIGLEIFLTGIL